MSSIEVNSSTDFDIDGYNLIWATWAALNLQLQAHGVMKSPYAERNWRNFSSVQLRYYVWPVWNFTKRFYAILKIRAGLSAVAASCQCQILSGEPTIPGKLLGSRVDTAGGGNARPAEQRWYMRAAQKCCGAQWCSLPSLTSVVPAPLLYSCSTRHGFSNTRHASSSLCSSLPGTTLFTLEEFFH